MGIVVCLTLLLVLAVLRPNLLSTKLNQHDEYKTYFWFVCLLSFIVGAWNSFYGLTHIFEFWGNAALISGLALMWASFFIFRQLNGLPIKFQGLKHLVVMIVAVSFLLYAITLIQLNLGFSFLGQ